MAQYLTARFDIQIENQDDPDHVELEAFGLSEDAGQLSTHLGMSYAFLRIPNDTAETYNVFIDSRDTQGVASFSPAIRAGLLKLERIATEKQLELERQPAT